MVCNAHCQRRKNASAAGSECCKKAHARALAACTFGSRPQHCRSFDTMMKNLEYNIEQIHHNFTSFAQGYKSSSLRTKRTDANCFF
jgi:hypothetical protein